MRYAIYGAGSLGTVLGAYITQNGDEIDLINRNQAHVNALNEHGARITGTVEMNVPVKAITPDEMTGTYDVILLMTKQLHNAEVVSMLKDYLSEEGVIVTLQNGLPEPGIAAIVGSNRTMGCVVEWGATLSEPGVCTLTSTPDSLSFHMGKMDGISDAQYNMVKELLERMCPVHERYLLWPWHRCGRYLRRRKRKQRRAESCHSLHERVHRCWTRCWCYVRSSTGQEYHQTL